MTRDRVNEPDTQPAAEPAQPDEQGRVRYGGGHQEGGGMIEPDEFAEGGTDVLDDRPDHGSDRPSPAREDRPG